MNVVNIIGNMTKAPEQKKVGEHTLVKFTIAVNNRGKDAGTSFFDCESWDKTAEAIEKYCTKGSKVGITGRLMQDSWEQDGQKRSKIKIVADQVEFLSPKNDTLVMDKNLDGGTIDLNSIPF